jgi:hypothetical protein
MDMNAYPKEVIISITPSEVLQLLAIDLDEDAEQAFSFLHEKIVERVVNSSCGAFANMVRGHRRCPPNCKKPCCLNGHRLQTKSALTS